MRRQVGRMGSMFSRQRGVYERADVPERMAGARCRFGASNSSMALRSFRISQLMERLAQTAGA